MENQQPKRKTPGPKPSANTVKFSLMLPEELYDWLLSSSDGASRRAREALYAAYRNDSSPATHNEESCKRA